MCKWMAYRAGSGKGPPGLYLAAPFTEVAISVCLAIGSYLLVARLFKVLPAFLLTIPLICIVCVIGLLVTDNPSRAFLAGFAERASSELSLTEMEAWAQNEMRSRQQPNGVNVLRIERGRIPQFVSDFASPRTPTTIMWWSASGAPEALSINFGGHYVNWGIIVFNGSNHSLSPRGQYERIGTNTYVFHGFAL
jgi:hypothetical protein